MFITRQVIRGLSTGLPRSIAAFCLLVLAMLHGGVALGQTLYFHNDALGNPVVATDAYGSVAWKQRYRPYGEPTVSAPVSAGENRLWFSGKPYDAANQLSYFGARYYEPASGRFFGIDPKEAEAADLHSINRYAYGNNNPLRYQDPNGLWAEEAVGGISLAISAHEFYRSPSLFNAAILATDAILAAIPGIPAFAGATVHGTKGVAGLTKALDASGTAASESGQVFQRVVSNAELKATQETGLLRGGRAGENFFSDAVSVDAKRAQQRLGLDGPLRDQRIEFRITNDATVSGPRTAPGGRGGTPGGGREFSTNEPTKIEILRVDSLRR
jgi:RHS repeat-associated protein